MKALTVNPEWAWAILHLRKTIEIRSWRPAASVTEIALHAGKANDPRAWLFIRNVLGLDLPRPNQLPASAIVAVLRIGGIHQASAGGCCDPWGTWPAWSGAYHGDPRPLLHWELAEVRVLAQPVPCRGWQRLWDVPPALSAQVLGLAA